MSISSTLLRFPSLTTTCIPRRRLLLSRFSLHVTPTRLVNASHRDLRSSSSSWRRPPRPDWLNSLDSKLIFYAIIAVNAGVYLTWELAMQTHVRHTHSPVLD
jgi:rhomboid-like protein